MKVTGLAAWGALPSRKELPSGGRIGNRKSVCVGGGAAPTLPGGGRALVEPGPWGGPSGAGTGGGRAADPSGSALPWQAGPWVPGSGRGPARDPQVSPLPGAGAGTGLCAMRRLPLPDAIWGVAAQQSAGEEKGKWWWRGAGCWACAGLTVSPTKQPLHGPPSSWGGPATIFPLVSGLCRSSPPFIQAACGPPWAHPFPWCRRPWAGCLEKELAPPVLGHKPS